uniref:Protein kinase domain-containing protein n=1 Tax=viral metagenome TaxID=1070528 RepID=A0A6C0IMI7_9ZZZZ
MVNSFTFTIKWIYFFIKFKLNYVSMTTTTEGGLKLKEHLLHLGIIGIKLGQFLYTNHEIINNEVRIVLESLLSSNVMHSEDDTRKMLAFDKNNYISNILSIEKDCLGSGSLAQVHICYLKANPRKKYILKVAHPCIFDLEKEVKLLQNILNTFSRFKKINIDWDSFFKNITVQIDLNNEANNMKKFCEIYKDYEKISIPESIYNDKYFIVMTYCEGTPMNKLLRTSKEYILATNLLASCFFHTVYKYNMCHGDMHFGNVLVKPNGYISLIDFGICNYSIDCHSKNNELIYNYREFILEHNMSSVEVLLSTVIKQPENVSSNYIINVSFIFIYYFQNLTIDYTKITDVDKFYLNLIFEFCDMYNLKVNGEAIYFILQLLILEAFAYTNGEHNGLITIRTMSYMKTEPFFVKEMEEFINKFYKLEYDHEYDHIRKKYP